MTEHTPGPWTVDTDRYGVFIKAPDESGIVDMSDGDSDGDGMRYIASADRSVLNRNKQDANARLIAAAPDLLAALERIADYMNTDPDGSGECPICGVHSDNPDTHADGSVCIDVRAAIAKARGEE